MPTYTEEQAIETVRDNMRLMEHFYHSKKIRNYNELVLNMLDDEHKQEYEKKEDENDKFYFLLMRLLETIPKALPETEKTKYEKELKITWHRLHKMLIRQSDHEAEIYEKNVEDTYEVEYRTGLIRQKI